jgi:hypothetical protein
MKKVEFNELEYWGWECPECKEWNETQDDPNYQEQVDCGNCGESFEPVSG